VQLGTSLYVAIFFDFYLEFGDNAGERQQLWGASMNQGVQTPVDELAIRSSATSMQEEYV
jgi:hypothetical protein